MKKQLLILVTMLLTINAYSANRKITDESLIKHEVTQMAKGLDSTNIQYVVYTPDDIYIFNEKKELIYICEDKVWLYFVLGVFFTIIAVSIVVAISLA